MNSGLDFYPQFSLKRLQLSERRKGRGLKLSLLDVNFIQGKLHAWAGVDRREGDEKECPLIALERFGAFVYLLLKVCAV